MIFEKLSTVLFLIGETWLAVHMSAADWFLLVPPGSRSIIVVLSSPDNSVSADLREGHNILCYRAEVPGDVFVT